MLRGEGGTLHKAAANFVKGVVCRITCSSFWEVWGYDFELLLAVGMRHVTHATRAPGGHQTSALETWLCLCSLAGAVQMTACPVAGNPHPTPWSHGGNAPGFHRGEPSHQMKSLGLWEEGNGREALRARRSCVLLRPLERVSVASPGSRIGPCANCCSTCRCLLREETSSMPLLQPTNTQSETPVGCCTTWPAPSNTCTA